MKNVYLLVLCLSGIWGLCACGSAPEPKTPVNVVQEDVEEEIGVVFAHSAEGDFYYNIVGQNTEILYKTGEEIKRLNEIEGAWRFSVVETKTAYPYMLFNGYLETESGYIGSLFGYGKEAGVFFRFFEEQTSNAVILPTANVDYTDLAWVLLKREKEVLLCPVNLRDGGTETGQIVSLAETSYSIEGENILVSLRTNKAQPLQLIIENKVYEGTSVISKTAYIYDFETETLSKTGEEKENANQQNN